MHNIELVMCCLATYLAVFILIIWVFRNKMAQQREIHMRVDASPLDYVVHVEEEAVA